MPRSEDETTLERQDRGDTSEQDKANGLPIGDDEDKRPRWAPDLRYRSDASERSLPSVDSVTDRLAQVNEHE